MEEKFKLNENRVLGFIFRYTPPLIMGSVCIAILNLIFKNVTLNLILTIVLFLGVVIYAAIPLHKTKRQLLITDKSIITMNDNSSKPVVLQNFDVKNINKITEYENGCYLIESPDNKQEVLSLAYFIPQPQELIFNIDKAFERLLGEKFVALNKQELQEHISDNEVPERVLNFDMNLKKNLFIGLLTCIIFGLLPTIYSLMIIGKVILHYIH